MAIVAILLLIFAAGYLGWYFGNIDPIPVPEYPYGPEVDQAWKSIACAIETPDSPHGCKELAVLRRAGWFVEKSGNERAAFVYLKILPPPPKD